MGRPSTFKQSDADRFVNAIRVSGFVSSACRKARLAPATVYRWLQRGETGEEPYATFLENVQAARSEVEEELRETAKASPHTATWLLERTFPAEYGMRDKVEQAAAEQVQRLMDAIVGELSDDAREQVLSAVARHLGGAGIVVGEAEGSDPGGEAEAIEVKALPVGS